MFSLWILDVSNLVGIGCVEKRLVVGLILETILQAWSEALTVIGILAQLQGDP